MVSLEPGNTNFKRDDVLVLLGAGASVEAGIPHSGTMVREIEDAVSPDGDWSDYHDLYNYIRSAVFYADGIRGKFDGDVTYNIERVVEALDELQRREEHPLYPFLGAWNPRLVQVAGPDFRKVGELKEQIVERLRRDWIEIQNYSAAAYYDGLFRFQQELNHPLRVFTLNYDLCVERTSKSAIQRGFDEQREWKWQLFEESDDDSSQTYLYKLHGSIDWQYATDYGRLTFSDSTSLIRPAEAALIFGTSYKLEYVDPFLFLMYEFRRWSLAAKLLVVIGYGFGDEHINSILGQALRNATTKRLVTVSPRNADTEINLNSRKKWVAERLGIGEELLDSIVVKDSTASQFFKRGLSVDALSSVFEAPEAPFDDLD